MSITGKWESIAEIRRRTGETHDQVVARIREGMANRNCRCRPFQVEPDCSVPVFQFDEVPNDDAEIEAETDRNLEKSGMFDSLSI